MNCKLNFLKIFFLFFYFALLIFAFASCNHEKNHTSGDTSAEDIKATFQQIIDFQDSIVQANNPGYAQIDDAYIHYLDSVCPLILEHGDFSKSGINAGLRKQLFKRLTAHSLGEIFIVGDTLEYFSMDVKKRVKRYFPYHVSMNNNGAYASLLQELSVSNGLIEKYYSNWMQIGDLSPGCYGMVLRDYQKLDFSDPNHRLLFTVTILRVNEKIADRFKR